MSAIGRQAWVRSGVFTLGLAALLFGTAGSLRFWQGWLYGFIFIAATSLISIYFLRHDPKLVERRMHVGPAAEREPTQKIIMTFTLLSFVLLLALPGFDHRWHWSTVPLWLVLLANAGVALSFGIFFVVLKQNSYAASTITVEPGQPVISTGLYAIVRHPLYAGALLFLICTPPALGSYRTCLMLVPTFAVLVWRLLDEERFLIHNLPGYAEYCRATRFRLIPRIW